MGITRENLGLLWLLRASEEVSKYCLLLQELPKGDLLSSLVNSRGLIQTRGYPHSNLQSHYTFLPQCFSFLSLFSKAQKIKNRQTTWPWTKSANQIKQYTKSYKSNTKKRNCGISRKIQKNKGEGKGKPPQLCI